MVVAEVLVQIAYVVLAPPGLMLPVRVAEVLPTDEGMSVVTIGATAVLKLGVGLAEP
jgi:hypothetical protein